MAKAVQAWLKANAIGALYIALGSPWEHAYVESFNSRLRDEYLNREEFAALLEAQVFAAGWRRDYNEARPHSSLDYLAPAVFADTLKPCDRVHFSEPLGVLVRRLG